MKSTKYTQRIPVVYQLKSMWGEYHIFQKKKTYPITLGEYESLYYLYKQFYNNLIT